MSETGTPTDHDGAEMSMFLARLNSEVRDFLACLLPSQVPLGVYRRLVDDVADLIRERCMVVTFPDKEDDHENS